jgi:hypothetical protein
MTKRWIAFAAALTLSISTAAWPAQAKTKPKSFVVAVPFDFIVGNRTLPAGSYRFQFVLGSPTANDTVGVVAVRSADGRYYASTITNITEGEAPSDGLRVVFSRSGDRASLAQLWEQGNPVGLTLRASASDNEVAADWPDQVVTLIPPR